MRFRSTFAALLLSLASAAQASSILFSYTGSVESAIDPSGTGDVGIGAPVSSSFKIDLSEVRLGSCLNLNGGIGCSYNVVLRNYRVKVVGAYSAAYESLAANFYVHDDVGGQDALGVTYTELKPGPFGSDLTGIQWQARYSTDALSSAAFSGELPFGAADWSLFALFRTPAGQAHLRGPLVAEIASGSSVPEPETWLALMAGFVSIGLSLRSGLGLRSHPLERR